MQRHSSKMTKAEVAEQVAVEVISSPMNNDIYICGFNMSSLAPKWKFSISVAGIFILYICFGALQEAIFSANDLRSYSPFLTLYQFGIYSILSLFELRAQGYLLFNSWTHLYAVVAVLTLGSIAFSNASVGFLNYPTQVIFKCCKMIPVLLGGVIIQGKRYSIYEVTAVLLMTLGLICFTLVDVSIQPKFTLFGVFLVSLALCCDGALGNCQEVIMKKYLFYSYSVGFCLLAAVLTISGNLLPSFYFFNDLEIKYLIGIRMTSSSHILDSMTTFRKAVSITLSFIMFEKPFSQGYIWSGLLVVFGLYLNLYNKNRSTWNTTILNKLKSFHLIKSDTKSILSV
ncbi:Adenosine 3'-phospho 5'-phosphosulfate transporter 2 [Schistosoma japonicum]|nr:Adenosine 3'-phospho 5'-phosphosulfate transporter 2 [Schistosoma japonicum]